MQQIKIKLVAPPLYVMTVSALDKARGIQLLADAIAEIEEAVDIVDVFRASDRVPEHLEEILAMDPLPKVVWLQQGIQNDGFAESLRNHGIIVVQDRCTLADHRALGSGPTRVNSTSP